MTSQSQGTKSSKLELTTGMPLAPLAGALGAAPFAGGTLDDCDEG
jgi:hypothetical protein